MASLSSSSNTITSNSHNRASSPDHPVYTPKLKRVLKSFQASATNSLSGPTNFQNSWSSPSPPSSSSPPSSMSSSSSQSSSNSTGNKSTGQSKEHRHPLKEAMIRSSINSSSNNIALDLKTKTTTPSSVETTSSSSTVNIDRSVNSQASLSPTPASNFRTTPSIDLKRHTPSPLNLHNHRLHNSNSHSVRGTNTGRTQSLSAAVDHLHQQHHINRSKSYSSPDRRSPPTNEVHSKTPIIIPADESRCEFTETLLHGEEIFGFVVGGEKRLCLPQILNSVLKSYDLPDIHAVMEELQVFCSTCTPDQLAILKRYQILPPNVHSCGLITRTDAERLVASLVDAHPPNLNAILKNLESLTGPDSASLVPSFEKSVSLVVFHECFGPKTKGLYRPILHVTPHAPCIQCLDCSGLFSPSKFVAHTHHSKNTRTCHWGFDSNNWRNYILLSRDQSRANTSYLTSSTKDIFGCCARSSTRRGQEDLEVLLDDMKTKFGSLHKNNNGMVSSNVASVDPSTSKRKESMDTDTSAHDSEDKAHKKAKILDSLDGPSVLNFLPPSLLYPGLYHPFGPWFHHHAQQQAAVAAGLDPHAFFPLGMPTAVTSSSSASSSSRTPSSSSVPSLNVISSSSTLEAAKVLASIQYQKQASSSHILLPNDAKSGLVDGDHPLMTGLFSLLDKHRVDRDLRDQILVEVKSIMDQVESNVRSSLLNGKMMRQTLSPLNNNNNNNLGQNNNHTNYNLLSLKQLAQKT